ncbi:MAG: c-type cytochrome [Roseitalea porphyridii]|uniref:c-type cytochrome n=1 Tax=Roseitalea porphyridii TaxID=1852022 RepID=UPI0032EF981C
MLAAFVAAIVVWRLTGQTPEGDGAAMADVVVPNLSAQAALGKTLFDASCADCHGANAAGRDGVAPPLVHIIYEPSHHSDTSFHLAVQNGVRAHHWSFGDMPPVEGVGEADVTAIIAYIRELQRANGID